MTSQIPASLLTAERHRVRHRWHRGIVLVSSIATAMLLVLAIVSIVLILAGRLRVGELSADGHRLVVGAIALLAVLPAVLVFSRLIASDAPRARGAVVTARQYPQIAQLTAHYAGLLGLPRIPQVVVVSHGDELTSSRSRLGRDLIVLHADLLEAPRPRSGEFGGLRFALAREIGHLASGGRSFGYQFRTVLVRTIPYLSRVLARAEDCTGDRWGALLAPDGAADFLGHLALGKSLWVDANLHEIGAEAGRGGVTETASSWFMSTPPLPWRVRALADLGILTTSGLHRLLESPADGEGEASAVTRSSSVDEPALGAHSDPSPAWSGDEPSQFTHQAFLATAHTLRERMDRMRMAATHGPFWRAPLPLSDAQCAIVLDDVPVGDFIADWDCPTHA
ncbi:MAG: hypothetical protein Q4P36_08940 [Bowdeniella nasicola]|nr:hypothetical protein [Bowdeniella nasicola]